MSMAVNDQWTSSSIKPVYTSGGNVNQTPKSARKSNTTKKLPMDPKQQQLTIQLLLVKIILLLPQNFRVGLLKASIVSMSCMILLIKKENRTLESTLRTNLLGIV